MAFAVEVTPAARHAVVAVHGDVDIATAPELRDRLTEVLEGGRAVVVDLGDVPFLDSTGLGVLVSTRRRAVAEGTALVVARPQRIVKNALSLARVDSVVDVYDTLDAAIDAVAERT